MGTTYEKATLTTPDISCGHCVATVKQTIGALKGVQSVEANHETKQVKITFDPQRISLDHIRAALDEVGYPARSH